MKQTAMVTRGTPTESFEALLPKFAEDLIQSTQARRAVTRMDSLEEAKRLGRQSGHAEGLEQGHAEGYADGLNEGRELGRKEAMDLAQVEHNKILAQFLSELDVTKQQLQAAIERWYVDSEQAMTDLAIVAVRDVLSAELELTRNSALTIVREALANVTHSNHARIRINVADLPLLEAHRAEIMAAATSLRDVEFVADASVSAGCIIETDGGVVDASTDMKLTLLQGALEDAA